jgi:hypothetical protein
MEIIWIILNFLGVERTTSTLDKTIISNMKIENKRHFCIFAIAVSLELSKIWEVSLVLLGGSVEQSGLPHP